MRILKSICLAACALVISNASAQIITNAYDAGTNYVTAGNFFTGDNQGSGFGPWALNLDGGEQSLVQNDAAQYGGYAFTIANTAADGITTASRPFSDPLPVGGSFSLRFWLGNLDNSSYTNGFELQDAGGNVLFSFYHKGGDNGNGWFTDAGTTESTATNFTYNYQAFSSLTFTLNSATSYTFKDNNTGASFSGTLSGAAITQVTFFRANGATAPSNGQVFEFNALAITTLGSKPVFDVQPNNAAAIAGGTVTFNAHATSNLGAPNYQWYFTNGPIAGATGTNLVLANVGSTNAGNYFVVVSNTSGAATSSVVVATIIPFGYTNAYDVAANYSGQITGNQGFGFAPWSVSTVGGGQYIDSLFAIWNGTGGDASTVVRPFNSPLPVGGSFLVQLQMNNLNDSNNLNALEFQDANGNVLFSYWHQGGDSELGDGHYSDAGVTDGAATNFWYHFGQLDGYAFTLTSATTYRFTDLASGANLTGTLSGAPITQVAFVRTNGLLTYSGGGQDFKFNGLTILNPNGSPPQFTVQPQYSGGLEGSAIRLSGEASGAGAVGYQWYFENAPLSGATNASLELDNAGLANSGGYFLVASDAFGSVTSMVSVVTVYTENNRLFAYEGFDYTGGYTAIDGVSQDGGVGWNNAWINVAGINNFIIDGSLIGGTNAPPDYDSLSTNNSYYNFDQSRAGRWLDCSTNGVLAARGYVDANGNIGVAGKTLYVSFLMQPDLAASFYEFEFHRADLNDPGRIAGIGNDQGTNTDVYFRSPNGTFTDLGVGDSLEDPSVGNHAVDFYVVRIDFQGGNDNVRVYRNPTSLTEPLTATVTLTNVGDMSFNGISLGAYGNYLAVDEIRLGGTWSDALGLPGTNNMLPPVRQGNGWNIQFAGNPGFTYRVQRATSLTGDWTDLGTATPAENGIGTVNDPNPPTGEAFYRTVTP